jgi:CheY-like chemotaxis protein
LQGFREARVENVPGIGAGHGLVARGRGDLHPVEVAGAGREILLVDDDASVRDVVRLMLEEDGYDVTVAADGVEALELARGRRFDLLVTDTVMPSMDGFELAAELGRTTPELRVLFTSGYAAIARDAAAGLGPRAGFLGKPFTQADLLAAVAALG